MTRKNDNNALALPPLKSESGVPISTALSPQSSQHPLKKRERQIIEISQEQRTVMEKTAQHAHLGMTLIGKIHEHASLTFDEVTTYIVETKTQPGRDQEHQTYIDQFSLRQVQLLAQEVLGLVDVSATGIALEVHRSLYPPPGEEKAPGFFERLFGKE